MTFRQPRGERMRQLRISRGYGLRRFALMVDMLPSDYCNIENGRGWFSEDELDRIGEVLGFDGLAKCPNCGPDQAMKEVVWGPDCVELVVCLGCKEQFSPE